MRNKKLTASDIDKLPRNWCAPGMTPEMNAWLDRLQAESARLHVALEQLGMKYTSQTGTDHDERVIYVEDLAGREGLLVVGASDCDFATWPSKVAWKGEITEESGVALERGLIARGCRAVRDFGGLWTRGGGAAVYGPVMEPGDRDN